LEPTEAIGFLFTTFRNAIEAKKVDLFRPGPLIEITHSDTWGYEMAKPTEKEIAARAYKLWESAGMPTGKDEEFWHAAEQELLNEDKSQSDANSRHALTDRPRH
jgi:hypothetical protein